MYSTNAHFIFESLGTEPRIFKVTKTTRIPKSSSKTNIILVRHVKGMGKDKSPNPQNEEIHEEQDLITSLIGDYGRWQLQLTCILAFFNLPCTWHIYSPVLQTVERTFWCARPQDLPNVDPFLWKNISQSDDHCQVVDYTSVKYNMDDISNITNMNKMNLVPCHRWEFNGAGQTLISEFNLVCERKYLAQLAEMIFLAGVAIGGIICGWFSDKYGRKKTLMWSVLLQTLIGIAIAFVPIFELYIILRGLLGFVSVSVVFSGFVLAIELVDGKWRTVAGVCYLIPLGISYMSIAGIAYLIRDWRHLQLAVSVPGFVFVSLWFYLPESPRWLYAMGRTEQLIKVLQRAALVNDRQLPQNLNKQLLPTSSEAVESVGISDLFKTKRIRKITLLLLFIWFVVYLVYYGLTLNVSNIGGDVYLNSVICGFVELPANVISLIFLLKMGRRWPFMATMFVAGIACIITIFVPQALQWLITSFAMFGRFSIAASNIIMPVYTAELYPTTIRNIGVGANNVPAGIALMLVPFLWDLKDIYVWLPWAVLGGFSIAGSICVCFLPETGHGSLQTTLSEDTNRPEQPTISTVHGEVPTVKQS